jgi:hypothetical protein
MRLGRTLASSGLTIAENRVADWALIELDPKAFGKSAAYPRNTMPQIPAMYAPYNPANDQGREEFRKEGQILDEFGSFEINEWYCKTGRTTGLTAGILNGITTHVNWPAASRERYTKDGKDRARLEEGVTEEWVITTESVGPGAKTQGTFIEEGDSGSGIIDRQGRICGLAYGGANALCGHREDQISGICASIFDIKRWIEEKVPGSTLGLPD